MLRKVVTIAALMALFVLLLAPFILAQTSIGLPEPSGGSSPSGMEKAAGPAVGPTLIAKPVPTANTNDINCSNPANQATCQYEAAQEAARPKVPCSGLPYLGQACDASSASPDENTGGGS